MDCLSAFSLKRSEIVAPGGGRSPIPKALDGFLQSPGRDWKKWAFDIQIVADGEEIQTPTHEID